MNERMQDAPDRTAIDLLARAIAIAILAVVIFIGLPFVAVLAAG